MAFPNSSQSSTSFDPYAALKIPEFRFFLFARLCFTLAIQIQAVVVGWQIYELTKDPLSLGLIGLIEAIPSIAVSLYAGHLADTANRKNIITVCALVLVLCSAALLIYSLDFKESIKFYGVVPIYCVIFLSGVARGFINPAIFSFMPQLLPSESFYPNAVSWNSTAWQSGLVAGPAIGGLIFGFFGIQIAYMADLLLILLAFLLFLLIGAKSIPQQSERLQIKESLFSGLRFVFANQIILNAISLDLFAVLFGGAVALLPIFASEILKTGPQGLGFLRAAPAVGSVMMAYYLIYRPMKKNAGQKMLFAVAGFGACMILFGLSTNFYLSLFLLILSGMFDSVSVIVRHTLMQTLTPENMKGRVSAVHSIFVGSSNEIGSFESGLAARLLGVVPSVIFGGLMTLGIVGLTAIKADKLRKFQFEDKVLTVILIIAIPFVHKF